MYTRKSARLRNAAAAANTDDFTDADGAVGGVACGAASCAAGAIIGNSGPSSAMSRGEGECFDDGRSSVTSAPGSWHHVALNLHQMPHSDFELPASPKALETPATPMMQTSSSTQAPKQQPVRVADDASSHSISIELAVERDRQLAREAEARQEILAMRAERDFFQRELELARRENELLKRERALDERARALPAAGTSQLLLPPELPTAQQSSPHDWVRQSIARPTESVAIAVNALSDGMGRMSLSRRPVNRDANRQQFERRSVSSSSSASETASLVVYDAVDRSVHSRHSTPSQRLGVRHSHLPSNDRRDRSRHSTPSQPRADRHPREHHPDAASSSSGHRAAASRSDHQHHPQQDRHRTASVSSSDYSSAQRDGSRNRRQPLHEYDDEALPHVRRTNVDRRLRDLPQFSGLPEEWPKFFESYHSTTEAYRYSKLENLTRLQKALTGEALRTVDHVLVYSRHVDLVMETLQDAFGQPDTLLRSQFARVQNLPVLDEARLEMMIGPMAVTVRNLVTFLDTPGGRNRMGDTVLMDGLVSKLPMSLALNWEETAERFPHPGLLEFSEWLTKVSRRVKSVAARTATTSSNRGASTKSRSSQQAKPKNIVLHVRESSLNNVTCIVCSASHRLAQCPEFAKLAVDDRWAKVIENKLCFRCLKADHMLPNCSDKDKCQVDGCWFWHNALLHGGSKNRQRSPRKTTSHGSTDGTRQKSRDRGQTPQRSDRQPVPSSANVITNDASRSAEQRSTTTAHQANASTSAPQTTANTQLIASTLPSSTNAPSPTRIMTCHKAPDQAQLLFRIVPITLYGRNGNTSTYALLDEGSALTLMDASLATELGLDGPSNELSVQWIGRGSTIVRSTKVALQISGARDDDVRYPIHAHTVDDLNLPTQTVDSVALRKSYAYIRDIPFPEYTDAKPRLLIGLDNHHLGAPLHVEMGTDGLGIMATHTRLGWVVYGNNYHGTSSSSQAVLHVSCETDRRYDKLDDLVRSFFSTEDFGVKATSTSTESDEVTRARQLLSSTTRRIGNRFETGLLWKTDNIHLPESRGMALNRLRNIEGKMRRDAAFGAKYADQIESYVAKGYARKLSPAEAAHRDGKTWYLPHFAAKNPNKPDKFRMVFDAAATVNGISLNSALLSGPDDNPALTRLLFRFRLGLVGICGDIREMFHQVQIRPADQNAQRFLWRGRDSTAPVDEYVMQAMTFGSTCSPASAQHVKNTNAAEFESQFPAAANAIRNLHYVDDYVASFSTADEAVATTAAVIAIHQRGGFDLRGFVSNNRAVMAAFGTSAPDDDPNIRLEPEMSPAKILGMTWNTCDDSFVFQTRFSRVHPDVVNGVRRPTKREVLSTSMSVFDPFGLLAEFMLPVKALMQDLWRTGVGWDEHVPEAIDKRWQEWRSKIAETRNCNVPRCYSPHIRTTRNLQLHVFADASEVAFAAVAFWRVTDDEGTQLAFVAGKSRCAPLQLLSVPRLELQAAVLATRLMEEVRSSHHDLAIARVVMWSDSETVLSWIRSDQRRYKPFVAFRVAEVVESAPAACWRWVPTSHNVADDATRVRRPHTFDPESRWLRGPAWLREPEESWPVKKIVAATGSDAGDDELRKKHTHACKLFVGKISLHRPTINFKRFSRFTILCRAIAIAERFIYNKFISKRRGTPKRSGELSVSEIEAATIAACRLAQQEGLSAEYAALAGNESIATNSRIFALKPYVDDVGVMRVHGRTDAAHELPLTARRPIILPHNHWLTVLIVRHHHHRMAHQLTNATMAAVRQKFWVPRLRSLVNTVRAGCPACKLRSAQPSPPAQGQLPRDRVTPYMRPFTSTGVDYFGPVQVTVNRHREKRWIALFTCLSTRAVHLEVAKDLSTDSCLVCIRNLCHLRGVPSLIRCDNGTNFVGARNALAREPGFFDPDALKRELACDGVEWRFNCPGNPEAGGAWERLVQSVKRILLVTLTAEAPHVETLRAALNEAANLINSRPLTHLPVDPDEPDPITPNHFIIGGPNTPTSPDPAVGESVCLRQQWRAAQELSRRFWRQWIADYLPELTRRSKHYPERKQLAVGDIVIVCDANQPRCKWARGIVVSTTLGKDGHIRTAEIRTANTILRRPVSKLAVLDILSPPQMDSAYGGRDVAN